MRIDPRHQRGRAPRGRRREAAERIDEAQHVVVRQAVEQLDQAHDRLVGHLAQQPQGPLELGRLQAADQAHGAVEQPDEHEEGRQPVAQAREVGVAGVPLDRDVGVGQRLLQDDDDRVTLADLALGDHATEPSPVVADRHVGRAGRAAPPDAPRLGDALHEAPRFRLRQREAGGAVAQAEGLPDLALGERLLTGHEVGVDPGDRRRDAPGGPHLAPGVGEPDPDLLGDGRVRPGSWVVDAGAIGHPADRTPREKPAPDG